MANARDWNREAEEWFLAEWERGVRRDYNHPCIVTWVPLNESFGLPDLSRDHAGQYAFVERVVSPTRRLDGSRPVVSNDGWEQAHVTDILSIHDYTPTSEKLLERYGVSLNGGPLPERVSNPDGHLVFAGQALYSGQPVMLTEVGGLLMRPSSPKEQWDPLYDTYASLNSSDDLLNMYQDLMQGLALLPFVAGVCYTQLTDIELETNGLLTYDRKPKILPELVAEVHRTCFERRDWNALQLWRQKQLNLSDENVNCCRNLDSNLFDSTITMLPST